MVKYHNIVLILAALGAINWGLSELGYNIVDIAFGGIPVVAKVVYFVIAICGVYALLRAFK